MPRTSADVDTSALESLDFPVQCEHSWHGRRHDQHDDGPATHVILLVHVCRPMLGDRSYFGCARWVEFLSKPGRRVMCVQCNTHMDVRDFAVPTMKL